MRATASSYTNDRFVAQSQPELMLINTPVWVWVRWNLSRSLHSSHHSACICRFTPSIVNIFQEFMETMEAICIHCNCTRHSKFHVLEWLFLASSTLVPYSVTCSITKNQSRGNVSAFSSTRNDRCAIGTIVVTVSITFFGFLPKNIFNQPHVAGGTMKNRGEIYYVHVLVRTQC